MVVSIAVDGDSQHLLSSSISIINFLLEVEYNFCKKCLPTGQQMSG